MHPVKILIADDHSITRLGLSILCKEALPFAEISEVDSISSLYKVLQSEKPDLLILDLIINETNCLTVIPELMAMQTDLNILVITMADEKVYGNRILKAGAKGYVNKLNDNEILKTAISRVAEGQRFVSHETYLNLLETMGKADEAANPFTKLTDKEMEIVHYLISGFSTNEISETARLASSTVSTYKNRIFTKLGIDNVIDLISLHKTYNNQDT